jgi:hypothetical protein
MSKVISYKSDAKRFSIYCPACEMPHGIQEGMWTFNHDFEKPTFSPSLLVTAPPSPLRCHSFVRDGKIQFLGVCNHDLKGQTVELPEVPECYKESP